jgi:hypothetical protein
MNQQQENKKNNYRYYNYFAILGHLASAITMAALLSGKNPLIIPYTETYSEWKNINNGTCTLGSRSFETSNGNFCISSVTKPVDCNKNNECYGINLGWLIISFHILSFIFQLLASFTDYTGPIFGYQYSKMVESGKNPLRFIEYSFSASIMLISIALLNGVTDINLITSIAILTSACQLCGLAVEFVENIALKWLLHLTGWLQFCWAYGIIGHAFFKSIQVAEDNSTPGPPDFVYAIVIILFLLYSSFGFVQLIELINHNNFNPFTKEKAYVILSLTAKLILGWMIFSNVLILS